MEDNTLYDVDDSESEEILDYRKLRKAETDQLESEWTALRKCALDRMYELIGQAYMAGMSVVDIKKAMGRKSVKGVLKTLKMHGVLPDLPNPGVTKFKLPENIRYALARLEFPFNQWCFVNGFDPKVATAALQKDPLDPMPEDWKAVHALARTDFPVAYADEYSVEPPEYKPGYKRETLRPCLRIDWIVESQRYCGTLVDRPKIIAYDNSMEKVFEKLRDYCSIDRQANRLEEALSRFEIERQNDVNDIQ